MIRAALDEPNYSRARLALNIAGFDLAPVARIRKDGTIDIRGLAIIELDDASKRTPASSFDLPNRRYGLRQIEKRHEAGALTIEQWWPTRGDPAPTLMPLQPDDRQARISYRELRDEHRRIEAAKSERRRRLAERHQRERRRLRARLMQLRRLRAARLLRSERRAFYTDFARTVRAKVWATLELRQTRERLSLRRSALPSWQIYRDKYHATAAASPRVAFHDTSVQTLRENRLGDSFVPPAAAAIKADLDFSQNQDAHFKDRLLSRSAMAPPPCREDEGTSTIQHMDAPLSIEILERMRKNARDVR